MHLKYRISNNINLFKIYLNITSADVVIIFTFDLKKKCFIHLLRSNLTTGYVFTLE